MRISPLGFLPSRVLIGQFDISNPSKTGGGGGGGGWVGGGGGGEVGFW